MRVTAPKVPRNDRQPDRDVQAGGVSTHQRLAANSPQAVQLRALQDMAANSARSVQLKSMSQLMAASQGQPVAQLARIVFRPYAADTSKPEERTENTSIAEEGARLGTGQSVQYPQFPNADLAEIHLIGHGNQGGIFYNGNTIWAKALAGEFTTKLSLDQLKTIRKIQFHSCMAADKSFEGDLKRTIVAKEGDGSVIERFAAELKEKMIALRDQQPVPKGKIKKLNVDVRGPYSRAFTHERDGTSRVLSGWGKANSPNKKTLVGKYGMNIDSVDKAEDVYHAKVGAATSQNARQGVMDNYLESEADSHGSVAFDIDNKLDTSIKGWNL
ncbi:hypothetical protein [Undibacterium terreum]|uniref:Uncharacterized protein n=1 Tax=Undibacterium terreum TaxID=1224302 RepID=A0A916UME0_9BURK|nr:hypothetical protein [Undibacterium terreum]GGC77405.1 hypothetical protein GCM10011396_25700 [Undibacterium terreum]